jgi:hypothetical protein
MAGAEEADSSYPIPARPPGGGVTRRQSSARADSGRSQVSEHADRHVAESTEIPRLTLALSRTPSCGRKGSPCASRARRRGLEITVNIEDEESMAWLPSAWSRASKKSRANWFGGTRPG